MMRHTRASRLRGDGEWRVARRRGADIARVFREWQQKPLGEVLAGKSMSGKLESEPEEWETVDVDAMPVCHHCILAQHPAAYFCHHCGRATGPYNNILPFGER